MTEIQDLVATIIAKRSHISPNRSVLVAVSGIDGSGKGYITEKLVAELNQQGLHSVSINLDVWHTLPAERFDAQNPAAHFYRHAFHFDRLFQELIQPLREQRSIHLSTLLTGIPGIPFTQIYDFQDVDVIVLEGIFLLKRSLRSYYDLAFWIECSFETALERALRRNQEGLPPDLIVRDYHTIYFPAEKLHLELDDPKSAVDAIYINDETLKAIANHASSGSPI
jgi:uridine kinase